MAGMNSGLYLNKQQVAFIIHPKQNNTHPNINKQCRGIIRIQTKQEISCIHTWENLFPVRLCSATNTSSSPLKSTKLMRQQHLFYSPNTQLCPLALSPQTCLSCLLQPACSPKNPLSQKSTSLSENISNGSSQDHPPPCSWPATPQQKRTPPITDSESPAYPPIAVAFSFVHQLH